MRRISPRPSTARRSLRLGATLAAGALVASALVAATAASAQAAVDEPLPEGASAGSSNIKLLQNLPKPAPFDTTTAFNSDLAFQGKYAYGGNYDGFVVYDLKNPRKPTVATTVLCPGSQNDVSVYGKILVLSTDSRRSDESCSSTPTTDGANYWEGLKIFDISDPLNPQYVKAVETKCGSHTHTLAPSRNGKDLYVYVSSYSPSPTLADCQPPHDLISVVKVPVASPADAAVVSTPVLFPDGGNPGSAPGETPAYSATSGCHDITAYPSKDIAAGACMGDGILLDIKDRVNPKVITSVRDTVNFAFWHSATFNNAGTKVVFTDELGGGGAPTCNVATGPTRGANAYYDISGKGSDQKLNFKSYFKIPRVQADTENCVAHNGNLIPVPGKDIMVQAWYQGGLSVVDFTNSAKPKEIAWFDRGTLPAGQLGGNWSTYWYNGYIYSNEIQRGFDVFELRDRAILGAQLNRTNELNAQQQERYRLDW